MVHWSLCARSELNFSGMWYLNRLHLGEGRMKEGAIHKSFLDIAASLPRTQFLPASLCLWSKLYNPCQSCLDCRLKVIHKQGEREWQRVEGRGRDGEDHNLLNMKLCSTHSYGNYLLLAFTCTHSFFLFFLAVLRANGTSLRIMPSVSTLVSWSLDFWGCFHQKYQLDGFKSRSNLKTLIKNWTWLWISCWQIKSKTARGEYSTVFKHWSPSIQNSFWSIVNCQAQGFGCSWRRTGTDIASTSVYTTRKKRSRIE